MIRCPFTFTTAAVVAAAAATALLAGGAVSATSSAEVEQQRQQQSTETDSESEVCRLWVAPSSVSSSEKTVFGLFAGIDYDANQSIPQQELGIPFVDFFEDEVKEASRLNKDILDAIESHVWAGPFAGAQYEGAYASTVWVPGMGALANYHTGVANVDWVQGSVLLRDRPKFTKPGAAHLSRGAITPYCNMTMRTTERIPRGMELFADFGESWASDNEQSGVYQDKVIRSDYKEADKILNALVDFMDKYEDEMTADLERDILDFILFKTLKAVAPDGRSTILRSLLPPQLDKLRLARDMGGTFAFRNQDMVKSQNWLEMNGYCIDKIRVGDSTIAAAGRGAFASRDIPTGSVITVVPVQPVAHKQVMNIYPFVETRDEKTGQPGKKVDRSRGRTGEQLAVNYCFGHPESSMLLMPLGPMITLVNHAPPPAAERDNDEDDENENDATANAYLDWSPYDAYQNGELLEMDIFQLAKQGDAKLTLELKASKDIKEGEEILINYGKDWENAWEKYKHAFDNSPHHGVSAAASEENTWPLKAEDLVLLHKDEPFPIEGQDGDDEAVTTACYVDFAVRTDGGPKQNQDGLVIMSWSDPKTFEGYTGRRLQLCTLLSVEESDEHKYLYSARTLNPNFGQMIELVGIPHVAVTYVDKPYRGDIHTPGAFRHYVGLEDDKFPQAWRNLRP